MYVNSDFAHPGGKQEHGPGHIHVRDSKGNNCRIKISNGEILDGAIDPWDYDKLQKWLIKHRRKLVRRFKNCMIGKRPDAIDGLVD